MCEEPTDGRKDAAGSRADDRRSSVEGRYRKIFEHNNDALQKAITHDGPAPVETITDADPV